MYEESEEETENDITKFAPKSQQQANTLDTHTHTHKFRRKIDSQRILM